jgi:hypothetical protein
VYGCAWATNSRGNDRYRYRGRAIALDLASRTTGPLTHVEDDARFGGDGRPSGQGGRRAANCAAR